MSRCSSRGFHFSVKMSRVHTVLFFCYCSLVFAAEETGNKTEIVNEAKNSTAEKQQEKSSTNHVQKKEASFKQPTILNITAKATTDFRPSPHLETYYEHNKFPVVPALPEAKYAGSSGISGSGTVEKVPIDNVWSTKVRFPVAVSDHPYPYTKDAYSKDSYSKDTRDTYSKDLFSKDAYANDPYTKDTYTKDAYTKDAYTKDAYTKDAYTKDPYSKEMDKSQHGAGGLGGGSYPYSKTNYLDTFSKKKPSKSFFEDYGGGSFPSYGYHHEMMENPWKKIMKMLVTLLPIGLLISALTPSVITISENNQTTYARAMPTEVPASLISLDVLKHIKTDQCDERVFCEILLSAGESDQSEKTMEKLLDNFMEKKGSAEKLNRIYKAIESGNCRGLKCKRIKDT